MPPLAIPGYFPQPQQYQPVINSSNSSSPISDNLPKEDKIDLKERNRIAAQKWRKKKDHYLGELETANDELRKKAFDLCNKIQLLRVENSVLENELLFFQSFMAKIMSSEPLK